jgi:hypothetical protein
MLRKIKNIIKGNLYYWNEIHNEKAMNSFCNKFHDLNEMEERIANFTLACSSSLISRFIGPERKKLTTIEITDKKMKTLTAEDHMGLLILCFEMFSKIIGLNNNENILTQTDKKFFGSNYLLKTVENDLNQKSIKSLIHIYGEAIAKKAKIIDKNDPGFTYSFLTLSMEYSNKISNQVSIIQREN